MQIATRLFLLILSVAAIWTGPEENLHVSISLQTLQQLDALASRKIESMDDATDYVRKAIALCVFGDERIVQEFESRLAAAELVAANDPNKLASDEQVAQAFNLMSDEFRVGHPAGLTASDILQYRSVEAAIFPHIFSAKSLGGSRPIGAAVILYQLWYNGGITHGIRNAAKLDRPPGSLKIGGGQVVGHHSVNEGVDPIRREYQLAGRAYFAQAESEQIRFLFKRLAEIMAVPSGDFR